MSSRKTSQQTISISAKLKGRIEEYVTINHENYPNDKRFRSVSSFYTSVMEKTLDCFDKGKTLDDFDRFVDGEVKDFFEKISFNALIPYYEDAILPNKYTNPAFEKIPLFFLTLRRLYMSIMNPHSIKTIHELMSRLRNYLLSNKLTKEIRLDVFTGGSATDLTGIFEYVGIYKNLNFEICKYQAAIFGLLGVKITECLYSEKDLYCRFDLRATDLFFRKELAKKEVIKLVQHNVSYFVNYNEIVNDLDNYIFSKMADDKNIILIFNSEEEREDWINVIKKDLSKFAEEEDFPLKLLKFFEKIHWVDIEDDTIFQIRLKPKMKYQDEIDFLLDTLSEYSSITESNGKYYLKKKE